MISKKRILYILEKIFDDRTKHFELASPRRIFVCPPDAPKSVQDETFSGNLHHIKTADFLVVNTRDKDIGTIWEAGYAHACDVPIVYFCAGLPKGAKFNLMLARSGIKVCTSFEQIEDYLDRCFETGTLISLGLQTLVRLSEAKPVTGLSLIHI